MRCALSHYMLGLLTLSMLSMATAGGKPPHIVYVLVDDCECLHQSI